MKRKQRDVLSLIPLMCSIPGEQATAALGISVSMVTETSQAKIAFAFYYPFPTLANESADLVCAQQNMVIMSVWASGVWETAVLSQYCDL